MFKAVKHVTCSADELGFDKEHAVVDLELVKNSDEKKQGLNGSHLQSSGDEVYYCWHTHTHTVKFVHY